ncbi:MAG: dihydrolipoamide acetyltransferase family protein [Steroidobacteraceae bacterium]
MSQRIHPITMPKWGIEMQEGTITQWHATPGETLKRNAPLLDVETEKIVNSVESPIDGTLRRVLAAEGDTCAVGALIGVYAGSDVTEADIDAFIAAFKPADTSFEPEATAPAATPATGSDTTASAPGGDGEGRVSPIARRLAERLGVDLSTVKGTGRNGRVSKEDVEAAAIAQGKMAQTGGAAAAPQQVVANEPVRERMTSMRLTIARRLSESKQSIPHYRLSADLEVGALFARRAALKAAGQAVSVNDLLLRAAALALVRHPQVNAQLQGEEVLKFPHADISVAVATEGGLVTPILRMADTKDCATIAREVAELASKAREGRLAREEITGGTFTVSNLGMFGIDRFDAIINPPQVGILAVGAAKDRVIARDGTPAVDKVMTVQLSADHRVVDGAEGARFLATLRGLVEEPAGL